MRISRRFLPKVEPRLLTTAAAILASWCQGRYVEFSTRSFSCQVLHAEILISRLGWSRMQKNVNSSKLLSKCVIYTSPQSGTDSKLSLYMYLSVKIYTQLRKPSFELNTPTITHCKNKRQIRQTFDLSLPLVFLCFKILKK